MSEELSQKEDLEVEVISGELEEATKGVNDCEAEDGGDEMAIMVAEAIKMQNTIAELEDKNVRIVAEMQNIKRRSGVDVEKAHKFGSSRFAKDLLEVGDSMLMGLKTLEDGDIEKDTIKNGMDMTYNVFIKTMKKHGTEQVGCVGEKFNPENHEAVSMVPSEEVESGKIIEVLQNGWSMNGRLLRPAMVIVAT